MKTIPQGTTKYLSYDEDAVERNLQRSPGRTEPTARVVVIEDGLPQTYLAHTVSIKGTASYAYSQHAPLPGLRSTRAVYMTTAEVVLDETEEAAAEAAPKATTRRTRTAAPTK